MLVDTGIDNPQGSISLMCLIYGTNSVKNDTLHKESWVAGFIEGEGSFNVAFKLNPDAKLGFYPSPTFSVTQHVLGVSVLELCKSVLGVGTADAYWAILQSVYSPIRSAVRGNN